MRPGNLARVLSRDISCAGIRNSISLASVAVTAVDLEKWTREELTSCAEYLGAVDWDLPVTKEAVFKAEMGTGGGMVGGTPLVIFELGF